MTSIFKLHCLNCGLSLPEASKYLDVNQSRAKEWWMGRRNPPEGVINELKLLAADQRAEARAVLSGGIKGQVMSDAVNRRLIDGGWHGV